VLGFYGFSSLLTIPDFFKLGSLSTIKQKGQKPMGEVHKVSYKSKKEASKEQAKKNVLELNIKALTLPQIDPTKIEEVMERTMAYLQECVEKDIKPGTAGLCAWLGIPRQTWYTWCAGRARAETHYNFCVRVMGVLDATLENYAQNGQINPVTAMWTQKNHFGYKDVSEVVVEPKQSVTNETTMSDVMALIEDAPTTKQLPQITNNSND
jgi:hypothetical protein